mgnify:CR=1 FL=1
MKRRAAAELADELPRFRFVPATRAGREKKQRKMRRCASHSGASFGRAQVPVGRLLVAVRAPSSFASAK